MKGKRAIYALYLGDEFVDIATKTRNGKQKTGCQAYRYFEERE